MTTTLVETPREAADLVALLTTREPAEEAALFAAADAVRKEHVGDGVHLRALIEFSSYCRGSCKYCGLRAANRELQRYRMAPEDIVAAAVVARDLGYRTVVLQSGEDASYTGEMLAGVVREIKALCDVAVTMCVGERPEADYALWREAGADRYLLRIETSDPDLYATLHPGMSFDNRLRCLQTLRRLDYELGCGVLIGLPGQSDESRARDLLFLADLEPDMLGLGPFIPHPQTPIADALPADLTTTLRMTALARLLLPGAHIVATTALGTIDPAGRERGLSVGADVVMPNVTPQQFRALYEIYPGKICINETPDKCRGCIELRIRGLGRHVAGGKGGRPKDSFPQGVDRE